MADALALGASAARHEGSTPSLPTMKKVLVFGVFDGLHRGHRKFLRQAKKLGDELVVVLARDEVVEKLKGQRPAADFAERSRMLLSSGVADRVVPGDIELGTWAAAKGEHPDIIALGYDQGALKAELEKSVAGFDPAPELVVLDPHRPGKYHTSIIRKRSADTTILRRTEKLLYLAALVMAPIALFLNFSNIFPASKENLFWFYLNFVIKESKTWGVDIVALVYIAFGVFIITNMVGIILESRKPDEQTALDRMKNDLKRFGREIGGAVRITIPILLNLLLISYLVDYINVVNRTRLVDAALAAADFWLIGAHPFLSLEVVHFPVWIIEAVKFSFLNLASFAVLAAVVIFFKSKKVFSKYALAFFASIFIMIPIWLLVPAMSPQDRFIDNVYRLPDPPAIAAELKDFTPVPPVQSFLDKIRSMKEGLDTMPTTTFPSAHAAWATIAFLCLLEASPIAAALFAPFLLLSTLGTFYLAQHYFVDAPAGIVMGVIAVLLANFLFKKYIMQDKADMNR